MQHWEQVLMQGVAVRDPLVLFEVVQGRICQCPRAFPV